MQICRTNSRTQPDLLFGESSTSSFFISLEKPSWSIFRHGWKVIVFVRFKSTYARTPKSIRWWWLRSDGQIQFVDIIYIGGCYYNINCIICDGFVTMLFQMRLNISSIFYYFPKARQKSTSPDIPKTLSNIQLEKINISIFLNLLHELSSDSTWILTSPAITKSSYCTVKSSNNSWNSLIDKFSYRYELYTVHSSKNF